MKKTLALVLAAVMALSLATVASAAALNPVTPDGTDATLPGDFNYGDEAETFYLEDTVNEDDAAVVAAENAYNTAKAYADAVDAAIALLAQVADDADYATTSAAVNDAVAALDPAISGAQVLDDTTFTQAEIDALSGQLATAKIAADADEADKLDAYNDAIAGTGTFEMSATNAASGAPAFLKGGKYDLSVSVSSDNSDVKASYKLVKNSTRDGVAIEVKLTPASEKFTVAESSDYKVKVKVVQVNSDTKAKHSGELEFTGTISNTRAYDTDAFEDASGNYVLDTDARVIDVSVFEQAEGDALAINYDDYSLRFKKVNKQNTSLYLYAKTDVVDVDNTKAIGSVGFAPTRLKDAATITMPISEDNQNFYGETVYVYSVVNGKPTGDAIAADVVNHGSVIFNVPAGTTLGTYAAYGAKAEGEAEKPAIPETGANDLVNLAIVFSVVALAAAGFVAVKKAGK